MILVDAGPLAALADADDQHHADCVSAFKRIREPLGTVWPAIAEAMYLRSGQLADQEALWEMLETESVRILPLDLRDIARTRALMSKYADLPMDLADAALITVAEREDIHTIFTVDKKDFAVYRVHGRIRLTVIP